MAVGAVFGEEDRRFGMGLADGAHGRRDAVGHFFGRHVGQAVEEVDGRVEFGQEVGEFGLHSAVAGKAQVDGGPVQPAAEDGGIGHAGTRGATALGDGGAVEDDGFPAFGRVLGRSGEGAASGDADFDGGDAVVEREVEPVFAGALRDAGDELGGVGGEALGAAHAQPAPAVGFDVEVHAADAGGGHVVHGQALKAERPAGADDRGVCDEARTHAGRAATQVPDGFADEGFGPGRQAVVEVCGVRPAFAFDVQVLEVVPEGVVLFRGEVRGEGLAGGAGPGGDKCEQGDGEEDSAEDEKHR